MAQRGRSARETREEIEAARLGRLGRRRRRLPMPQGGALGWLLLGLVLGVIIAVVSFALLPEDATEWITDLSDEDTESGDLETASESALQESTAGARSVTVITTPGSSVVEVATPAEAPGTSVVETSDEGLAEPVSAEEAFADMFQSATRVDKVSIDDIKNCRVSSQFEVKLGDIVSVEVALARKEDGLSGILSGFRPYFFHIRDTSGDGVLGNHAKRGHRRFGLVRTISNPWNEANAGPYVVAVYRGQSSVLPEAESAAIGDWVDNWGGLVPGEYTVGFVEDENISSLCADMHRRIDVTNLVPDSVLIAWYVNRPQG